MWEFPKIRGTVFWGSVKGLLSGTIRIPLKGSIKGLEFLKIRGTVFWGPYNLDPTI